MQVPKNTLDFSDIFHNEEVCLEYFEKLRWPEGIICPACQCKEVRKHKRGYYVCVKCRSDIHQTAGTVFHRSRISLRTLFWLVWLCVSSKQGVSSEELSMSLGIGSRISWQWLHKIRRIMVLEDRTKLSGNVEVDEVFIGGKKAGKRGRGAEGKAIVAIAVEIHGDTKAGFRGMGRVRMKVIGKCGKKELHGFIQNNIDSGAQITTDDWKGYYGIEEKGYEHKIETHSRKSISSTDEGIEGVNQTEVTPNVHIIASLVKRWLLGTHQQYLAHGGYLQPYLEEYTFRYNRRKSKSRGTLFVTIMEQIAKMPPTTLKEIMKKAD